MIKNILLATDGSAPAERAADFAASLARRYDAKITVLHAYHPVPSILGEPEYSRKLYKTMSEAEELVESVVARLREQGVKEVDSVIIAGRAVPSILDVAETRKPDLLVLGARGRSPWQGMILGSVSMAVTQRAACPVLVVK